MRAFARHLICWPLVAFHVALATMGTGFHLHSDCDHASSGDVTHDVPTDAPGHHHCCSHSHCDADVKRGEKTPPTPGQPHDHDNCVVCQFYAHLTPTTAVAVTLLVDTVEPFETAKTPELISAAAPRTSRPRAPPAV